MLFLASGVSPRRSDEGYEKANCRRGCAQGLRHCPGDGSVLRTQKTGARFEAGWDVGPPICPSTLDEGTHLGSPGSPLGASLPIELWSQLCSSRCASWELCYCPPPLPSGSCSKWLGNPTSNDSDYLPNPTRKTRTILDDCTISHRRTARPSQFRAGNVRFDRCCVIKGAVSVSRSSGRRR